MPSSVLDLTDKKARFPIAYNLQPVVGWPVSHYETVLTQHTQRHSKHALAKGPWDGAERVYVRGGLIAPTEYIFHPGDSTDAVADAFFPDEPPHPFASHISVRSPAGLSESDAADIFAVYRTLRTPNFDEQGRQIDAGGNLVPAGADWRDHFFYWPNPATCVADQILRWGNRRRALINWPAWCEWRDWNAELIWWDDARITPRGLSLTPTGGGALVPGTTYYIRVSSLKGGDESSASRRTASIAQHQITLAAGQTALQVSWLLKEGVDDQTGFRVYVGTVPGVWHGFFEVANPAARNYLLSTLAGVTAANPRDEATAGLLRQIPRFECGLWFIPPYDMAAAVDAILAGSCADWQWSGWGTNEYRNDMVRFLSPVTRAPVLQIGPEEIKRGTFKAFPVDTAKRPNQIEVIFRDKDDRYIGEADPVILNRDELQALDGVTRTATFNIGTAYRSQAQRCASFWARTLCDSPEMATLEGGLRTYFFLTADVAEVTHDTPDWAGVQFIAQKKRENIEGKFGDPLTLRTYIPGAYSDSGHHPLPSPLPPPRLNPLAIPPPIGGMALSQVVVKRPDATYYFAIKGVVQFANFHQPQRGRVYVSYDNIAGPYTPTGEVLLPDPTTNQDTFEYAAVRLGTYYFKIVTESALGVTAGLPAAAAQSITVVGALDYTYRVVETMRVRQRDRGVGFLLAAFPASAPTPNTVDLGADLWRSRDGVNYEYVLAINTPAIAGQVHSVLDTNGVGLSAADTFNDGSTAGLVLTLGAGQTLIPAVNEAAVRAGHNAALVGKERIGFLDTNGTTFISGILRGQDRTEHAMDTHHAEDHFILLTDAVLWVPCSLYDVGVPVSFKIVPRGKALSEVAAFTVTLTGEAIRGAMPLEVDVYKDARDWLAAFDGRALTEEEPASFAAEVWNPDGTYRRTLTVSSGMHAALMRGSAIWSGTIDEATHEVVYLGTYVNRNNLLASEFPTAANTLEKITRAFTRVDFAFVNIADALLLGEGEDGVPAFALQSNTNDPPGGYSWPSKVDSPVSVWFVYANEEPDGTGLFTDYSKTRMEVRVYHYGELAAPPWQVGWNEFALRPYDPNNPTQLDLTRTLLGYKITIILMSGEYRVYDNYQQGARPRAIIAAPSEGFPFPLRGVMQTINPFNIENVMLGTNKLTTIYSEREQIADGGATDAVRWLFYQKMPYAPYVTRGQIYDRLFVVTSGGETSTGEWGQAEWGQAEWGGG